MKYRAKQLQNGKFAVFAGSKYFTGTISTSKQYVKEQALILSAQFYQEQMDKAFDELKTLSRQEYNKMYLVDNTGKTDNISTDISDLMC